MVYPTLELWSDDEIGWIEVPETLHDELAEICSLVVGDLPILLCWRDSEGDRWLFDRRRFLSYRRNQARKLDKT